MEDDDLGIQLAKALLFERDGLLCNWHMAKNGAEALKFLRAPESPPIDLVLLDINMPVMNGFEFLQTVRADTSIQDLPILMCTTSNYDQDIKRAYEFGVLGYMNKPVTLDKMRVSLAGYEPLDFLRQGLQTQLWRH